MGYRIHIIIGHINWTCRDESNFKEDSIQTRALEKNSDSESGKKLKYMRNILCPIHGQVSGLGLVSHQCERFGNE